MGSKFPMPAVVPCCCWGTTICEFALTTHLRHPIVVAFVRKADHWWSMYQRSLHDQSCSKNQALRNEAVSSHSKHSLRSVKDLDFTGRAFKVTRTQKQGKWRNWIRNILKYTSSSVRIVLWKHWLLNIVRRASSAPCILQFRRGGMFSFKGTSRYCMEDVVLQTTVWLGMCTCCWDIFSLKCWNKILLSWRVFQGNVRSVKFLGKVWGTVLGLHLPGTPVKIIPFWDKFWDMRLFF